MGRKALLHWTVVCFSARASQNKLLIHNCCCYKFLWHHSGGTNVVVHSINHRINYILFLHQIKKVLLIFKNFKVKKKQKVRDGFYPFKVNYCSYNFNSKVKLNYWLQKKKCTWNCQLQKLMKLKEIVITDYKVNKPKL